ncbi:dTMP kinase [Campylobacter concisus]|uniref:dTMP kinase n=1 Tax=Campylobacter concisus TaxID=199 RepID=UPI000CD95ADC|nr:dTMP kinase [Campylobacter concisus]QPH88015.1 dTMP kinase [Campylobacter concisus]QPI02962.1 dTMP kinase [Campylobacter concisus]
MYVLFEGIDGVGKSTQIEILASKFPDAIVTKEPGGTQLGENLREILLSSSIKIGKRAEILLFLADRAEHFEKLIQPNLGRLILSDRGFISGIAYALANDENLDENVLLELNKFALNNKFADKIIFFEASYELIGTRLKSRGTSDKIEARGLEYLLKVQSLMKQILIKNYFDTLFIDASKSIELISKEIENFINFK